MSSYRFETLQVHAGQEPDPVTGACAVPIYQTNAYVFDDCQQAEERFALSAGGNIYTRLGNPTTDVFEKRMAALENGTAAVATASGMAAVAYALQALASQGDHIVSQKTIYGGTYNLLSHTFPSQGISTTFVNAHDLDELEAAIQDSTRAVYLETMGNPNSDIVDIEAIAGIAHRHGIPLVVDNTFGAPSVIRPLEHGADIVVHSATKFLGGHGASMGGVVVDGGRFDWARSGKFPQLSEPNPSYHGVVFADAAPDSALAAYIRAVVLRDTGACLSPFNAFLLLQGLETLSLRMDRHTANAIQIAEHLSRHPQVDSVSHPALPDHPDHELYKRYFPNGAGAVFTFEIQGGKKAATTFLDALELFQLVANVADVRSLAIHPATTTHSQLTQEELAEQGISDCTIRLSVGIENVDDLIEDLERGFEAARKAQEG